MTQPPAFPARLLKRLLPNQSHEVLLGDLCEAYQHKPSATRYWREVLTALPVGAWRDIRTHKRLAARAIATGLATLIAAGALMLLIFETVTVLSNGGYMLGSYWITLPPHIWPPRSLFLLAILSILSSTAPFAASGWMVGRFHRVHGTGMVLAYLGFLLPLLLVLLGRIALTAPGPRAVSLYGLMMSMTQTFVVIPISVLMGGFRGTRPSGLLRHVAANRD